MILELYSKFPFILDRNLAKANCTGNRVCTSCDIVVLDIFIIINDGFTCLISNWFCCMAGNAAFETADALYGHTNMVHMLSRSRARLAWSTHYVGDLRWADESKFNRMYFICLRKLLNPWISNRFRAHRILLGKSVIVK